MNNNLDILKELELEYATSTEVEPTNNENTNFIITEEEYSTPNCSWQNETIYSNFEYNGNKEQNEENLRCLLKEDIIFANHPNNTTDLDEKGLSFFHKIKRFVKFILNYVVTSSVIFLILLTVTNFDSYYTIGKSYIEKDKLEQTKNSIINSVNASSIISLDEDIDEIHEKDNLEEITKNNKDLSIKKMAFRGKKIKLNIDITPFENRIIIPKIGKNIPLVEIEKKVVSGQTELNNIFMQELEKGVIRYPGSAKPGEIGNSFIFGHSSNYPWIKGDYNNVFALLDKLDKDDEIIVYFNQNKYIYKVKEKIVISPGNVSILKRNKEISEVSIMTCWPIGTTLNRLVVIGDLIQNKDV